MKRLAFLSFLSLGLCAQTVHQVGRFEATLHLTNQSYESGNVAVIPGSWTMNFSNDKNMVAMLRFGYDVVQTPTFSLQLSGAYEPERSTSLTISSTYGGTTTVFHSDYSHSAKALGLMARFHGSVVLGGGLEYRSEDVSYSQANTGGGSIFPASGSLSRAWVRASLGIPFGTSPLRPTLGLEVAKPLSGGPDVNTTSTKEDMVKHLAPSGQIGLFFSLHF